MTQRHRFKRILNLPFQRCFCATATPEVPEQPPSTEVTEKPPKLSASAKRSHSIKLGLFFRTNPHILQIKDEIPSKYLALKRRSPPESLYLIDKLVAKDVVSIILPILKDNENQLISETNAGLGFIGRELLENGIKLVRFYESCPDFKLNLQDFRDCYPSRVEVFPKDLFLLPRFDYMDKQDHGCRVDQLLKGVPKKSWTDGPSLSVIGSMPNKNFMRFLLRSLILQHSVISYGRFQIFAFMQPKDFVVSIAGPHLDLHSYQAWSVLANLFFDLKLLAKYPRNVFLPWESRKVPKIKRYLNQIDPDQVYLVQINLKTNLPVKSEDLLAFHSFVTQFYGKGTTKVVPMLEKWVPGSGLHAMIPKLRHEEYFKGLDIYTQFGELNPNQILSVFKEMINHSEYEKSPFLAMIESQLLKTETIETNLDEQLEKNIVQNLEEKVPEK